MSFPDYWTRASKNASASETWLIQLGYGTGTDFLGLSDRDIIVSSNQYYGIVYDWGNIKERIDLPKSQTKFSNLRIVCHNKLKTGLLTDIFFTGTAATEYINRDVKVFSRMGDTTDIADCQELFRGRLIKVDFDTNFVTLEIVQSYPWWNISIPNKRHTNGKWGPIAYGDYVETEGQPINTNAFKKYPAPYAYGIRSRNWMLTKDHTGGGDMYHYDEDCDGFYAINGSVSSDGLSSYNGIYTATAGGVFERDMTIRGTAVNEDDEFTNTVEQTRIGDGSYASSTASRSGSAGTTTEYLRIDLPDPSPGVFTALTVEVNATAQVTAASGIGGGENVVCTLYERSYGSDDQIVEANYSLDLLNTVSNSSYSRNELSDYQTNNDTLPDYIELKAVHAFTIGAGDSASTEIRVNSVYLSGTIDLAYVANEYNSRDRRQDLEKIPFMYIGQDGLTQSYTSGSGIASLPHEIHRDILERYCGLDDTDGASSVGWSDLNTDRSDWECRYWLLEPEEVQDVLNKLQFEGCFVFFLEPDGGFKYIHVEDSYTSGDVVRTYTLDDVTNYNIGTTDFDEVVTKITVNYERHPAENSRYVSRDTYTNTAARTAYWKSVITEENEVTYNLDALCDSVYDSTDTNPNDNFTLYYDNIVGSPKVLVNCDVINKGKSDVSIGDIVKFSFSGVAPFSKTWSSMYFMITETRRTPNSLNIVAREVYST